MFKIGEFSKLTQVPIKTLRYYDSIDLFRPSKVDLHTGYRYYAPAQVPRLNRILVLKDLGFSLEQIQTMLDEGLTSEQLRGMLRMKHAEIERQVYEEQARLARIENRLKQIEREGTMTDYDVVIKKVEPVKVLALRDVVPSYQSMGALWGELGQVAQRHGISPTGPSLAKYYDESYKESDVDVEVMFPIAGGTLPADSRATIHELEGVEEMAVIIRKGDYSDFTEQYQALMGWITDNGYEIASYNREIYLQGPESGVDPSDYITEIQFPVRQAK